MDEEEFGKILISLPRLLKPVITCRVKVCSITWNLKLSDRIYFLPQLCNPPGSTFWTVQKMKNSIKEEILKYLVRETRAFTAVQLAHIHYELILHLPQKLEHIN